MPVALILHKLYVDFKEASKKNPCSVKFKTDRIEEIINLHKIKFNNKYGGSENVEVVWDDDPPLNGCIQLLTISEKSEPSKEAKKILTIFFFHSGVVLCQGEYMMHYKEFVFPQIISQLSSEGLNPQTPKASGNSYESNSLTPKAFSPITPIRHGDENLQNVIRKRLDDLKKTPTTPQAILNKHFIKVEERVNKLEKSLLEVIDNQNNQFKSWSDLFDKQSKIFKDHRCEYQLSSIVEKLVNERFQEKEDVINSRIENIEKSIEEHNVIATELTQDSTERIEQLEGFLREKEDIIHSLKKENTLLKERLSNEIDNCQVSGNLIKKLNNEITELKSELHKSQELLKTPSGENSEPPAESVESIDDDKGIEWETRSHVTEMTKEEKIDDGEVEEIKDFKETEVVIPVPALNKILEELQELKSLKQREESTQNLKVGKKIEVFCDSFGKHIDEEKCFGRGNKTTINACFTMEHLVEKIRNKRADSSVSHVLIHCGFNDLKNSQSDNKVISAIKPALELLKSRFPNALILIGEVLPHPSDEQMNKRISLTNFVLGSQYSSLTEKVRYVEHPVCRKEDILYDKDGIHLNKDAETVQLLKDFFRVSTGKKPFTELKRQ